MSKDSNVPSNIENLIILNKLQPRDYLLFLYSTPEIDKFDTFLSFLRTGQENNISAYISAGYTNRKIEERFKQLQTKECKFYFGWYGAERINQELSYLYKKIQKGHSNLRLVVDYGDMPKLNHEETLKIEKNIHEIKGKNPFVSVMSAFDTASLDHKTFSALSKFHEKILVQTENKSTVPVYIYNDQRFGKNKEPSLELISKRTLKKAVKDNLRLLILGILNKNEMSGYDLIKLIHKKFKFGISPGTMYPLLFSIKKEGLIEIKKNEKDLKRKVYVLTREGKKVTVNEIMDFLAAKRYLSDLI